MLGDLQWTKKTETISLGQPFFFFFLCCVACRSLVSPLGIKPVLQWKCRVSGLQANILGGVSSLPPTKSSPRWCYSVFMKTLFSFVICQWCICTFVHQLIYVYVSLPQLDIKLMCRGSVYLSFVIPEKIKACT